MLEIAKFLHVVGGTEVMLIATFLISGVLFLLNKKDEALVVSFSLGISTLITYVVKHLFKIPRPENMLILEDGYRFPSGHATAAGAVFALCVVGAFHYLPGEKFVWQRRFVIFCGLSWLCLSAYSRMYLHVHELVDVIVGAGIGIATTFVVAKVINQKFSK